MTPDEDCLNPIRLTPEQKQEILDRGYRKPPFTLEESLKSAEGFAFMMRGIYNIKGPGDMALHQGMALYFTPTTTPEASNG